MKKKKQSLNRSKYFKVPPNQTDLKVTIYLIDTKGNMYLVRAYHSEPHIISTQ